MDYIIAIASGLYVTIGLFFSCSLVFRRKSWDKFIEKSKKTPMITNRLYVFLIVTFAWVAMFDLDIEVK